MADEDSIVQLGLKLLDGTPVSQGTSKKNVNLVREHYIANLKATPDSDHVALDIVFSDGQLGRMLLPKLKADALIADMLGKKRPKKQTFPITVAQRLILVEATDQAEFDKMMLPWINNVGKQPPPEHVAVDGFIHANKQAVCFMVLKDRVEKFLTQLVNGKIFSLAKARAVPVEDRKLALSDMLKAVYVNLTGERVPDALVEERLGICTGEPCRYLRQTSGGQYFCGICACNIGQGKFNLAAMVEQYNKQGKIEIGCKHPERKQGKGWRN